MVDPALEKKEVSPNTIEISCVCARACVFVCVFVCVCVCVWSWR